MNARDLTQLQTWVRTGATLADVERAERLGFVENERFSEQAVRAYRLLWTWTAPRFGGAASNKQDRFFNKCGAEMYRRRLARAQAILARLGS